MSISAFTDTLIATVIIHLSYFREKNIHKSLSLLQQIGLLRLAHDLIFLPFQNRSVVVHDIICKIYQLLRMQKKNDDHCNQSQKSYHFLFPVDSPNLGFIG